MAEHQATLCRGSRLQDERGQSLIQVLVSVGIMGILISIFSSLVVSQNHEITNLTQRLASVELRQMLLRSLSDGSVCQYILGQSATLSFNANLVSSGIPQIVTPTFQTIYSTVQASPLVTGAVVAKAGEPVSAYSDSVIVKSISLSIEGAPSPLLSAAGQVFTGNWVIDFDSSRLKRPLRPVTISTYLVVDTTSPTSAVITGCPQGGMGAGTVPTAVAGPGLGPGATVSVNGTDTAGVITFITSARGAIGPMRLL